jgi:Zn-dependent protease
MPALTDLPWSPFLIAVLLGWILSVCFHEFCHALVAYWAGDASVKQRGYLGLNPAAYIDPLMSIVVPAVILLLGGMPLPGAAVRIDQSALRSRAWASAVSAAGPAANLLLFVLLAMILHPGVGLVDHAGPNQPNWVRSLGVLTVLQLLAVMINLLPMPPFDGFGIIEPYLDYETRRKLRRPAVAWAGILILFFVVFGVERVRDAFYGVMMHITGALGLPWDTLYANYNLAFFGSR